MAALNTSSYSGQGSLYAFTLPLELLECLHVRLNTLLPNEKEQSTLDATRHDSTFSALSCAACGIAFASLTEQRLHFRSDWHRYNVKMRLTSGTKAPVAEEAFNVLVDSLEDSLSGSASSESSISSGGSGNAVSRLMRRNHLEDDDEGEERTANRSPLLWMTADTLAPDTQFGFYRIIFPSSDAKARSDPVEGWPNALMQLQVQPEMPKPSRKLAAAMQASVQSENVATPLKAVTPIESRTWTFLFTGGGHFAGMIVSLVPKISRGQGGKLETSLHILAHKTYHRYTTRRKQGGAQSANDAAKGTAKSVGSQLRRANEAALADDIRALLLSWKELLSSSQLVFMRASRSNARIFFDYSDALLERGDPRIRSVPFSTRRPTLAELERCFKELTTVKTSHLSADALAALDEAEIKKKITSAPALPSIASPPPVKPEAPKLSREEMLNRGRWERVEDMARRGRLDALIGFIERHPEQDYTGALPDWMSDHRTPTLLHVAAQADQAEVVRWLLYDRNADPTAIEVGNSRPAYDLCPSRATRNAFRRCMSDFPDKWDWLGSAHVPSPLTAEQEAKERARDDVKRKAQEREEARAAALVAQELEAERAAQEAKDAQRIQKVAAQQASKSGPQRLGGGPPQRLVNVSNGGLSDEQKMRMEREQRARAAEARLERM